MLFILDGFVGVQFLILNVVLDGFVGVQYLILNVVLDGSVGVQFLILNVVLDGFVGVQFLLRAAVQCVQRTESNCYLKGEWPCWGRGTLDFNAFQESLPKPGETAVFCVASARSREIKYFGRLS